MDSHNIVICNDKTVHMVQLPPPKPNKANTIETFARLSSPNSQLNIDQLTNGQPCYVLEIYTHHAFISIPLAILLKYWLFTLFLWRPFLLFF